ncbi:hypothetical protein SBADM41S_11694 [Streptomyces badius]
MKVHRAGKLKTVSVKPGGRPAAGIRRRPWTSDRVAAPGTAYTVEATDADGGSDRATFATAEAEKVNKLSLAPGKNTTVGIAQPLSVVFDHPVKNKAAVEKALKVSTSNGTEGSWGWLRDYSGKDRVDWRPEEYWKPGTKVSLDARLNGVDTGAAAVRPRLRDDVHDRRGRWSRSTSTGTVSPCTSRSWTCRCRRAPPAARRRPGGARRS